MATHHPFPNLQVSEHPLVRHKIRLLADKHTEPKLFRELTKELTALLVYEATRGLPTREVTFETPLEETMGALDHIVRSGRAQYIGISSYNSQRTREAVTILKDLGTPLLIHQPSYNILNRWVETDGLKDALAELGVGSIAFVPLAQGILTNKYLNGIPAGSRATQGKSLDPAVVEKAVASVKKLHEMAESRGQTLAQMALAWVLRNGGITSALIGASKPEQVVDCVGAIRNRDFTADELARIDAISEEKDINLWARSSAD